MRKTKRAEPTKWPVRWSGRLETAGVDLIANEVSLRGSHLGDGSTDLLLDAGVMQDDAGVMLDDASENAGQQRHGVMQVKSMQVESSGTS